MEENINNTHQLPYEEVLEKYGECITHVTGWSMEPLLHNRQSIVRVVPAEKGQLKVGDVVLYKVNEQYILHRIMRIQGDTLIIRGDNNWFLERISKDQVIGVMTEYCRRPNHQFRDCCHWTYETYKKVLPIWRVCRIMHIRIRQVLKNIWKLSVRGNSS